MLDKNSFKEFSVLFVDDEEKSLKYFKRLFHDDFDIKTASSAYEAEEVCANEENIAVLITDQRMPSKTGIELIKSIREKRPEIIRIITTAYADTDNAIDAINIGEVFKYIKKPWNIPELHKNLTVAMEMYIAKKHIKNALISDRGNQKKYIDLNQTVLKLHTLLARMATAIETMRNQLAHIDQGSFNKDISISRKIISSKILLRMLDLIESERKQAHIMINVIFNNASELNITKDNLTITSVVTHINEIISLYNTENRVKSKNTEKYIFLASNIIFYYVLFNILKNAIYAIAASEQGEIKIHLTPSETLNYLHVKDTGLGIAKNIFPNLFCEFYPDNNFIHQDNNFDISFFKKVMMSFGGDISCELDNDNKSEYTLSFPRVHNIS